jgi:hypothetical protein
MNHVDPPHIRARNADIARRKLELCICGARECSRNSWQFSPMAWHKREYIGMRRQSMQDARYWRDELKRNTEN